MNPDETSAQRLIKQFNLQAHPEGGYYRETYRSPLGVMADAGRRSASTAIYYMLESGDHSAWHRIASDELWHFYTGSALNVYVLDDEKGLVTHRLGDPLRDPACTFQAVVPAGCWFAAQLASNACRPAAARLKTKGSGPSAADAQSSSFALVGCTVAPGFEFSEFEMADTCVLIEQYPAHAGLIARLAPIQR